MKLNDLLKGKTVMVNTDMNVKVTLVIADIQEVNRSEDLEPATAANDWWPKSRDWIEYEVKFTNGKRKTYHSLEEIEIVNN